MVRHEVLIVDPSTSMCLSRRGTIEAERYESGLVGELLAAVRAQLGLDTVMLLCLRSDGNEQTHLLQTIGPVAGADWFRDPALERIWLDAAASGMVWARPGWIEETRAWVEGIARAHGAGGIESAEQRRAWEFSCLVEFRAGSHEWILKCLPRPFLREVRLLRALSAEAPAHLPAIVASDESRHCVLMQRSSGIPLGNVKDQRTRGDAVASYARLQIAWCDRAGELADLGLPDRSLSRLLDDMQRLFADDTAMLVGEADGLTVAEVEGLRGRAAEIESRCHALGALTIPATIEHGDLWEDNILIEDDGRAIFLDWTDASIAHPFFSLYSMFAGGMKRGERQALRDRYLAPWRARFSGKQIEEAFDLAQVPAALHHAVNYHRFILPMVRTERSARRLLPFYLRRLLAET